MILSCEGNTYFAISRYDDREVLKQAGFRWNRDLKRWETADPAVASRLIKCADDHARALLADTARTREESIEASKKTSSDFNPPCPDGLSYLPFQKAGIVYGLARRGVLLGDEMGLGKTVEALGIINALPESETKRILVVCPASLKINWQREASRWLVQPREVAIAESQNFPDAKFVICNYDILRKHYSSVQKEEWDVLVVDECHYLKSPRAQRTFEVLGGKEKRKKKGKEKKDKSEEEKKQDKEREATATILEGLGLFIRVTEHKPIPARRRIFLTGTPILNRPVEIWSIAHALAPGEFPDFWKFTQRYCDSTKTHFGWDMSGASHLDELQLKLRASCMIRRLKSEVMPELPPKRRQVVPVAPEGCEGVVQAEKAAYDRHIERTADLRARVELAKASEDYGDYEQAVAGLKKANQVAFTEMALLRHDTARAKVPFVVEHIKACLEEESKLVVFAHHHDVIDALCEGAGWGQVVKLTGEMKIEDRQQAVDRFQKDPSCKVFVGSIKAAGLGITLTAASHVIFAELDWVPASITQAEDRLHRIGQAESVLVQHLVFDESLDADMAKSLVAKQAVIDQALDDGIPDLEVSAAPASTEYVSRRALEKEAEKITDEQVAVVHETLRMLSKMCDGARSSDGSGFGRSDVRVGHSLAEESRLTKKQAALGMKICIKYKRQYDDARLAKILGNAP